VLELIWIMSRNLQLLSPELAARPRRR
jgi:hypothetical protein